MQVFDFRCIVGGLVERHIFNNVVGHRNIETIAEFLDRLNIQFFLLVGGVLALTHFAHAETFHGFRQDYGRLALMLHGGIVSGMNLVRIMATTVQAPDVFVGHSGDHFKQLGVFAEEVLAHVSTIVGLAVLVFTIDHFQHDFAHQAVFVASQQFVPVATPNYLQHIPA